MKADGLLKPAGLVFGIALILYIAAYSGIEHRRTRQGPWQVTFTNAESRLPAIIINQPTLAISNVLIIFPDEPMRSTNGSVMFQFSQPEPVPYDVPFGTCLFMDTTFLPGTIVFKLFGHEIQLIPRVLTIDQQERPWRSNETIVLAGKHFVSPSAVP